MGQGNFMPESIQEVSFEEVCAICHITPDFMIELIAYGTIEPNGNSIESFRFDATQIQVIRTAARLHEDLEVNHAGVALAIDLLHQVQALQTELNTLKKYFDQR